jgi:hypothetical protein
MPYSAVMERSSVDFDVPGGQHVAAGGHRGQQQVELAGPPHQVGGHATAHGDHGSAVVAGDPAAGDQRVVPGGVGDVLVQDVLLRTGPSGDGSGPPSPRRLT